MIENREGQRVPEAEFKTRADGAWKTLTDKDVFAGKTVVVFALPGAFTPTCSSNHVPRYNELVPKFRELGVDTVACLSVNDAFVMEAWQKEQEAPDLLFLPDGNGDFSRGLGILCDKRDLAFGERAWRCSMLVKDGVIEKMFIEPEKPGDPFEVSDAETMLRYLDADVVMTPDILMFSREGCGHCVRAGKALEEAGLPFDTVKASPRRLKAVCGRLTTPQVFIDGVHIGGADELAAHLEKGAATAR